MRSTLSAISVAILIPSIAGHCVFIDTVGDAGRARGYGLGVDFKICRNGGGTPCQKDITVFAQTGSQSTWKNCGKTHMQADRAAAGAAGFDPPQDRDKPNDPATMIPKMIEQGAIPLASAGGYLNVTIHQVNVDGAGPFRCGINSDGLATNFKIVPELLQQAPGDRLGLFNDNSLKRVPIRIALPADLKCTGTYGAKKSICILRCQNPAANGPFGSCMPFELKVTAPPPKEEKKKPAKEDKKKGKKKQEEEEEEEPEEEEEQEEEPEEEEEEEEEPEEEEKRRRMRTRKLVRRQLAGKPSEEEVDFLKGGEAFTAEEDKVIRNGRRPSMFAKYKERTLHSKNEGKGKAKGAEAATAGPRKGARPPSKPAARPASKPAARPASKPAARPASKPTRKLPPKKPAPKKGN